MEEVKPAVASIADIFVVIVVSNGCFWLSKGLFYLVDILTYKMQLVAVVVRFIVFLSVQEYHRI